MTLFMPPIQRKKKVEDRYRPDSFRVISEDAISDHPKYKPLPYRASFEPRTPTPKVQVNGDNKENPSLPAQPLKSTRVLPRVLPDYRGNNPQPLSCGFLDKNVRFLNEPICNVYTSPVQHKEKDWWPSRANPGELLIPPYAEHTNYRYSFNCRHGERPMGGSGRHSSNLNREQAKGIVPVNYLRGENDEKKFFREGMSYEHMYNSRSDPNYPIRGKRHGAFVWSRMDPISQKKFVEYYQNLDEEDRKFEEMKKIASAKSERCVESVSSPKKTSATAFTKAKLVSEHQEDVCIRAENSKDSVDTDEINSQMKVKGNPELPALAETVTDKMRGDDNDQNC